MNKLIDKSNIAAPQRGICTYQNQCYSIIRPNTDL